MSHARQQIRDYVAGILTGLPTTQRNVLVGKRRPFEGEHPPALVIYTTPTASGGQETAQRATMTTLSRTMMLTIQGHVKSRDPPDNVLDDIAAEVEAVMGADTRLGNRVVDCVLHSTVSAVETPGVLYDGAIRLIYAVTYRTAETTPTVLA